MARTASAAVLTRAAPDAPCVMPFRADFRGVYCSEPFLSRTWRSLRSFPVESWLRCGRGEGGSRGCPDGAGEQTNAGLNCHEVQVERSGFPEARRPVRTHLSPGMGSSSMHLLGKHGREPGRQLGLRRERYVRGGARPSARVTGTGTALKRRVPRRPR